MSFVSMPVIQSSLSRLPAPIREKVERYPLIAAAGTVVTAATVAFAMRQAWLYGTTPRKLAVSNDSFVSLAPLPSRMDDVVIVKAPPPVVVAPASRNSPSTFEPAASSVPTSKPVTAAVRYFRDDSRYQVLSLFIQSVLMKDAQEKELFSNALLKGTVPQAEEFLANCSSLSLRYKHVAEIMPGIEHMPNLKKVDFSNGKLTSPPPGIGTLKHLEFFSVENNKLTTIPEEWVGLPQSCVIKLGDNHFGRADVMDFRAQRQSRYGTLVPPSTKPDALEEVDESEGAEGEPEDCNLAVAQEILANAMVAKRQI